MATVSAEKEDANEKPNNLDDTYNQLDSNIEEPVTVTKVQQAKSKIVWDDDDESHRRRFS